MAADLEAAESLLREGNRSEAGDLFGRLVKEDPNNEQAWLGLAVCVVPDDQKRYCLNQVLRINPANESAIQRLQALDFKPEFEVPAKPKDSDSNRPGRTEMPAPISQENNPASTLDPISIILIVLLVLLAGYWLIIAFVQIYAGTFGQQNTFDMLVCGGWNIFASLINLLFISDIVKRAKRVPRELMLLAVVGIVWGGFQLIQGAILQACAIPLYLILGVLGYVNRERFDVGGPNASLRGEPGPVPGAVDDVTPLLEKIEDEVPTESAEVYYKRGYRLMQEKQYETAKIEFARAIRTSPTASRWNYVSRRRLREMGLNSGQISAIEGPGNPAGQIQTAGQNGPWYRSTEVYVLTFFFLTPVWTVLILTDEQQNSLIKVLSAIVFLIYVFVAFSIVLLFLQ